MMGPYSTKKRLHSLGKRNKFRQKMYILHVYSIIQEDLQKILNKKNCNKWGRA